jgi:amino acid adenylation domain-containing protein
LHAKFELNALNYPQQLALEYLHQSITYQALNEQANQLANFLIEKGILPGGIIAIHFTPGIQQIIAVLAVLKTGCAYLPIDVEHPTERIEYMIHNAGVAAILCDAGLAITNKSILTVFELNSLESSLQHSSTHSPEVAIKANDLAYIIYTSGSTGLPKGVMIEHGNAWNTLMQMGDIFPLTNTDKFSLNASLGFDPSVWMIFWPLMVGATVVLSSKEKDPVKICEDIIANQYRVFHAGPTLFRMLSSQAKFSECNSLRLIIGGGEAWKLADLEKMRKVLPQLELCNVYGPTEASIHVTFWLSNHCDMQSLTTVPIGKAIKHMQVFLLDEQLQEIAPGQVGDLYVAGAGIGRGYINNNELTAEKFIDANLTNQSVRLYSTGDLARILPDGNLVFMGRADDQIKLRGYRIEPTEIESQILKTGLANDVCVIGCLEEQTFSKLAAFIVAKETGNTTIDIIKKHLRDNLPE